MGGRQAARMAHFRNTNQYHAKACFSGRHVKLHYCTTGIIFSEAADGFCGLGLVAWALGSRRRQRHVATPKTGHAGGSCVAPGLGKSRSRSWKAGGVSWKGARKIWGGNDWDNAGPQAPRRLPLSVPPHGTAQGPRGCTFRPHCALSGTENIEMPLEQREINVERH